ncbi:sentrin-specific protease 1-like [Varroa jacobsoni]|nr:sentrin-specific protease 1-like isoform X2 [Varroa destructor]XP_022698139.1 sentrin-specific protease 1-like [Varroa jacobsoni]
MTSSGSSKSPDGNPVRRPFGEPLLNVLQPPVMQRSSVSSTASHQISVSININTDSMGPPSSSGCVSPSAWKQQHRGIWRPARGTVSHFFTPTWSSNSSGMTLPPSSPYSSQFPYLVTHIGIRTTEGVIPRSPNDYGTPLAVMSTSEFPAGPSTPTEEIQSQLALPDKHFQSMVKNIQRLARSVNIHEFREVDLKDLLGTEMVSDNVIDVYMQYITRNRDLGAFAFPARSLVGDQTLSMETMVHYNKTPSDHKLLLFPVIFGDANERTQNHMGVGYHWGLAAANLEDGVLEYYDSWLGTIEDRRTEINKKLARILEYIKTFAGRQDLETRILTDIPQQSSSLDCGIFTCMYAENLVNRTPMNFYQVNMPTLRRKIAETMSTAGYTLSGTGARWYRSKARPSRGLAARRRSREKMRSS